MSASNHSDGRRIPYNTPVFRFLVAATVLLVACGPRGAMRMTASARYEVGEDATVAIEAPAASESSPVDVELVLVRPDGTEERQGATLKAPQSRVRLSTSPAFTQTGQYQVRLVSDGRALAAPVDINITIDRLTELLAETIADYKAKKRYTRARQAGALGWKQYGGIYQHPYVDQSIEITIEEPGEAFKRAWTTYEEEGTLAVLQNNYVRVRERATSATASWTSQGRIIQLRAPTLAQMDPKFVARFFVRYPSDLHPVEK
jgi:hypothetical protein